MSRVTFSWNWQANKLQDQSSVRRKMSRLEGRLYTPWVRETWSYGNGSDDSGRAETMHGAGCTRIRCTHRLHLSQRGCQNIRYTLSNLLIYYAICLCDLRMFIGIQKKITKGKHCIKLLEAIFNFGSLTNSEVLWLVHVKNWIL